MFHSLCYPGVGIFNYDPYAYLNDQKHFLRPLGTEGQGSPFYPERQSYGNMAFCFPIGMGIKYNLGTLSTSLLKFHIGLPILITLMM